mgnify:CR=1 FL=1
MRNQLFKLYIFLFFTLTSLFVLSLFSMPNLAGEEGNTVPGKFTSEGFTEPITFESTGGASEGGHLALTKNLTGTAVQSGGAITPQVDYRLAFDVARPNGLNTAASITVKMFYAPNHDGMTNAEIEQAFQAITETGRDAFVATIDFNASSAATFTHVSNGALTSWELLTSSAVTPGESSGDAHTEAAVQLDFVPSKVAREDTLGDWLVMVELNDISNDEPIRTYDRIERLRMQWYGEITVPSGAAIDFGTINVNNLDNTDNDYIQIKATSDTGIRFIANGGYVHTLKAAETWTSPKGPAQLNTEAATNLNLTAQGFALRGNVFDGVRDLNLKTVQLRGESQDFHPRFTRSDETGNMEDLYIHLRVHPEFQNAVYSGQITFGIAPYSERANLNTQTAILVENSGIPVTSDDDFKAMDDGKAYGVFGVGTPYERLYPVHSTSAFIQTTDLDLSSLTSPVFTGSAFQGHYHGQGHQITGVALTVSDEPAGLFERAENAIFEQMVISASSITQTGTNAPAGMMVGEAKNITMDAITLSDTVSVDGQDVVGGLVGQLDGTSNQTQSPFLRQIDMGATVQGGNSVSNIGGLIGQSRYGLTLKESLMRGTVIIGGNTNVGGFIGGTTIGSNDQFVMTDNLMTGSVTASASFSLNSGLNVGGFVGNLASSVSSANDTFARNLFMGTIASAFSTRNPDAFVATGEDYNSAVFQDNFYLEGSAPFGLKQGSDVTNRSTRITGAAAQTALTYDNFDFKDVWGINNVEASANNNLPFLKWQGFESFDLRIGLDGPDGQLQGTQTFVLNAAAGPEHPNDIDAWTLTLSGSALNAPVVQSVSRNAVDENINVDMETLRNGTYTYTLLMQDTAGNTRSAIKTFSVNNPLPELNRVLSIPYIGERYIDIEFNKIVDVSNLVINEDITVRYLDTFATDNDPFNATITSMTTSLNGNNTKTTMRLYLENRIFTGPIAQSSYNRSSDREGHYSDGFDHTNAMSQYSDRDPAYNGWVASQRYQMEVQISTSAIQKISDAKSGEPLASAKNVTRAVARPALPDVVFNDYAESGNNWDYGPQGGWYQAGDRYGVWFWARSGFWLDEVLVRATPGSHLRVEVFETDTWGDRISSWSRRATAVSVSDEIYTSLDISDLYIGSRNYYGVAVTLLNPTTPEARIYRIRGDKFEFAEGNNNNGWTRTDLLDREHISIRKDFGEYYYGVRWGSGSRFGDYQSDSSYFPDIGFD